jgi:hypothetical protein
MRAYLSNLLPRLQQFSQTLDKKEILIDQPWVNVDDDLNKVQYIFRRDGSLIMSLNGNALIGKWEYISGARSLLVDVGGKKLLLNHGFVDKGVMALKKDGFQDAPWVLVNERIIPDLDAEKYLNNLLREKLHIKVAEMENGIVFEFSDPYSTGLNEGSQVMVAGLQAQDGIYKSPGNNVYYSIFSKIQIKTDKGLITINKPFFYDISTGNKVFMDLVPARDGYYKFLRSELSIKDIIVRNGYIEKIYFKKNYVAGIVVISLLVLIIAIIYFLTKRDNSTISIGKNNDSISSTASKKVNDSLDALRSLGSNGSSAFVQAPDYKIKNRLSAYLDVLNTHNYDQLNDYYTSSIEKYFKLSNVSKGGVVNEIKRYNNDVVKDSHTSYFKDSMVISQDGQTYIVNLPLIDFSTLRKNDLPYIYVSHIEYRLDKDLNIFYVSGNLIKKELNFYSLLNLRVDDQGNIITVLNEDFFNNIFSKMSSPYSSADLKDALKTALIKLTSLNVEVLKVNNGQTIYLPDFCDQLINGTVRLISTRPVNKSGSEIYKLEVYTNEDFN